MKNHYCVAEKQHLIYQNQCSWCGEKEIPFHILLTKTDKLSKNELAKNISAIKKGLAGWWEEIPPMTATSSEKGIGKSEVLSLVEENMQYFVMPEKKTENNI